MQASRTHRASDTNSANSSRSTTMARARRLHTNQLLAVACVVALADTITAAGAHAKTPLKLLESVHLSTVGEDFRGDSAAFSHAIAWHENHLYRSRSPGAHIACAEYGSSLPARSRLVELLAVGCVRPLSNHKEHGACFIVTASPEQAAELRETPAAYGLRLFFPLPSVAKVAPGLLDHGNSDAKDLERLQTTYGDRVRITNNVHGLSLGLSPGVLPSQDVGSVHQWTSNLRSRLMSDSVNLHAANFWSDPAMLEFHEASPEGALRAREWTRAADVVHQLSSKDGPSPAQICSWHGIGIHHISDDHVIITGLDHLLPDGRGAGGRNGAESEELKAACFMGIVSLLASTPQVLRVSPLHRSKIHNAVAASVIQAGTIDTTQKPLTDAGLDGTGEVIQIIDTGVDETSCFFVDDDGEEVEHGYYFDEVGFAGEVRPDNAEVIFSGGSFPYDLTRRKIIQYIRLVAPDDPGEPSSFVTGYGGVFPFYSSGGFGLDMENGHGTHTAGSAAGATLNDPPETESCSGTDEAGCVGGCLNASYVSALLDAGSTLADFDTWCPQFDCDGYGSDFEYCLDGDVSTTLVENGGMARGAKLAIFDTSLDGNIIWGSLAGTGVWGATYGTGCLLHSNSWGGDSLCTVDSLSLENDEYMWENPDHLLIFAAGNDGESESDASRFGACTMNAPGIGKNVLTVGASSSGITRLSFTGADGDKVGGNDGIADIDTVAFFSSRGATSDERIKPDVVAPGDQVLSAASDGTKDSSCKLYGTSGTSMSAPIVAGAAAMIRQYFVDPEFYEADVNERGLCAAPISANATNSFVCEAFSPYAATLKAMLINSADLMGGSSQPDGDRGFGRVHLETVLPLDASGDRALFVQDASERSIPERKIVEFYFLLNEKTGVDLRATLAWIDPAASEGSSTQLLNDLDLTVVSPSGEQYRMWSSGADDRNVVERVIVPSDTIDSDNDGEWRVAVSSGSLTTAGQPYSLVVTGPIAEGSGDETIRNGATRDGGLCSFALALTVASTVFATVAAILVA